MKIFIITPALPPKLNGIGDYAALLAAEMAKSEEVTVISGSTSPDPIPGVVIETPFSAKDPETVGAIFQVVQAGRPDWVILQYNPFSYGKWGLNLQLPNVVKNIKKECKGTRVALMVHEPFVPIDNYKFAVFTTWQRWQLWQLGQAADIVFFSIEAWAKKFRSWFPRKSVTCSVVGSNIPYIPTDRMEVRAKLGISEETVVLGYFGSTHPSRLVSWVKGALEGVLHSGRPTTLLYVGAEGKVVEQLLGDLPHINVGPQSAPQVSRMLSAMDVYLSPFDDGVSTRRGSFLAGIQHGLPTVGTSGYNTSKELLEQRDNAYLLADARSPDQFQSMVAELAGDSGKRERIGAEARNLFVREFAWNSVAMDLHNMLDEADRLADPKNWPGYSAGTG